MESKRKSSNSLSYGFVRLILVKPFVEEMQRRRISIEPALSALGLEEDDLDDPERYVHAETIYALMASLATIAQDPHIGYHVGSKLDFAEWPPFKTAVQKAKTVGEFMTAFISAVPSEANSVKHELLITSDAACYRIIRLVRTNASPEHTEAFGIAVFIRLFQAITGTTWKPEQVTIKSAYRAALPNKVQGVLVSPKAEGGLELHFPIGWLYEPIQLHSTFSAQDTFHTQLEETVSLLHVFRASAKSMLHDLSAGLSQVADTMGVNSRALEAALKTEGTSAAKEFRRLRVEAAKNRLCNEEVNISTIAADLGYSDPAHFTRFFKSQTGESPKDYRTRNTVKS